MKQLFKELGFKEIIALLRLSYKEERQRVPGKPRISKFLIVSIIFICCIIAEIISYLFIENKIMVTIEIFQFLVYLIICGPIGIIRTFNFKRLKYITQFVNSAWWNNTHIPPSQILLDNGIYGEFIATMATEQNLKANHL